MRRFWVPLCLGAVAFAMLVGPETLAPWRDGWLMRGSDRPTYRLGWRFFRDTDWSVPPASSPRYGIELGSSVFYSDIIPLLALPLKLVSAVLPIGQYFGAWLLLCCLLQAVFAWVLLSRAGVDRQARIMGSALLLFAPFFFYRLYEHFALAAQWMLLAALWLATTPGAAPRRPILWLVLVGATAMVHASMLVMVGAVWAADWLRRLVEARRATLLAEAMAVLLAAIAGLWAAGFFAVLDGRPYGSPYGWLAMDVLGPVLGNRFSLLIPDFSVPPQHEGASVYLGSGGLLVVAAALVAMARAPGIMLPLKRFWPLLAVMTVLLALAVTHRVTIAGHGPFVLPVPSPALALLDPLRSSNRFAWPVLYSVLVLAVVMVARQFPLAVSSRVLLVAAVLQVGDSILGWVPYRLEIAAAPSGWVSPLNDPFWAEASGRYARLRQLLPTGQPDFQSDNYPEGWAYLADYAYRNGWDTDVAYLARVSREAWVGLRDEARARVAQRRWEAGTLYVVQLGMQDAVRLAADPERDLFAEIDGIAVFAPGWHVTPAAAPAP